MKNKKDESKDEHKNEKECPAKVKTKFGKTFVLIDR